MAKHGNRVLHHVVNRPPMQAYLHTGEHRGVLHHLLLLFAAVSTRITCFTPIVAVFGSSFGRCVDCADGHELQFSSQFDAPSDCNPVNSNVLPSSHIEWSAVLVAPGH